MPDPTTPAELIAELERRADRADLASAFTGDKTARDIYADALALVRPVVERLERDIYIGALYEKVKLIVESRNSATVRLARLRTLLATCAEPALTEPPGSSVAARLRKRAKLFQDIADRYSTTHAVASRENSLIASAMRELLRDCGLPEVDPDA